jgi:hypothetical protein
MQFPVASMPNWLHAMKGRDRQGEPSKYCEMGDAPKPGAEPSSIGSTPAAVGNGLLGVGGTVRFDGVASLDTVLLNNDSIEWKGSGTLRLRLSCIGDVPIGSNWRKVFLMPIFVSVH